MRSFKQLYEFATNDAAFREQAENLYQLLIRKVHNEDFSYTAVNAYWIDLNDDLSIGITYDHPKPPHNAIFSQERGGVNVISVRFPAQCFLWNYAKISDFDKNRKEYNELALKCLKSSIRYYDLKQFIVHELIHYLDHKRGVPMKGTINNPPHEYINSSDELNAWFQSVIHSILNSERITSVDQLITYIKMDYHGYWELLTPENKKKVLKRAGEAFAHYSRGRA